MQEVSGRNAFVTGGASGIGLALAKALARNGAKVTIADIHDERLAAAVREIEAEGGTAAAQHLDVTDRQGFERAADKAESRFGPVDILCANAGVGVMGSIRDISYADWDWGLGVNLGGTVNSVQTFVPRMIARAQGGHVLATASAAGLVAAGGMTVYVAAKMAVVGMMEVLRGDLAPDGIGVTVLCPHFVRTNISEHHLLRPDAVRQTSRVAIDDDMAAFIKEATSCGMDPAEVADKCLDAIRENRLYAITHPELREPIEQRFKAMLGSVADGMVDARRRAAEASSLTYAPYIEAAGTANRARETP